MYVLMIRRPKRDWTKSNTITRVKSVSSLALERKRLKQEERESGKWKSSIGKSPLLTGRDEYKWHKREGERERERIKWFISRVSCVDIKVYS